MATHLKFVTFLDNLPNRLPSKFSYWLRFNGRRTPCLVGFTSSQSIQDHVVTRSVFSQFEGVPVYHRRRRSLTLKDSKNKSIFSQQILRRKQDFGESPNAQRIIEREYIWTIPNILCVSRITVCPFLGYLIIQENYLISCVILAVGGITDFLDGFIARNFKGQSSKLGSFLDPLADKVLVATVFSTLTFNGIIPVALTSIIVARDVFLAAAGFFIRYQSLPPPKSWTRYFDPSHATAQLAPTFISKINTFVQLGTICCTLSAPVLGFLDHPHLIHLWWLTGATTILSAGSYLFSSNTYRILKKAKVKRAS
uniref:cardiolipin synthase (CMP-forming) n=1 Tax=Lygus hesperus TaxID=30085 RepID=A0A0K8TE25_LYGHE